MFGGYYTCCMFFLSSILLLIAMVILVLFQDSPSSYSEEKCTDPKHYKEYLNGTFYYCPYKEEVFHYMWNEMNDYFNDGKKELGMDFNSYRDNENIIFFDVGANIGLFTFNAANLFPKSKIYAFEPIIYSFETLLKNIEINNLKNVYPFNVGFSDTEQEDVLFNYVLWNPGASSSLELQKVSSDLILCLNKIKHWENKNYVSYLVYKIPYLGNLIDFLLSNIIGTSALGMDGKRVKGSLIPISKFIKENNIDHIDFLKIDVEGSEYQILKSLEDDDWEKIHYIAMEVHPFFEEEGENDVPFGIRIKDFLEEKGYEVSLINKCEEYGFHDLNKVFQDLVARRKLTI